MGATQHDTPKKARLKGAFEFLEYEGLHYKKADLFRFFYVSRRSGYEILADEASDRTRHNHPTLLETRGRKRKVSETELDRLEDMYEEEGFEAKRLAWPAAALEAGIERDISERTLIRAAHSRGLYKRLAEQIEYRTKAETDRRVKWAEAAIEERPDDEDWRDVYFSDECHYGYGDEARALIARKPGTQYDPSNLQERKEPSTTDEKRLHCWAAIGYDFKSPLIWYEVPTNTNGKMTQVIYIKEILEPYVKKWIDEGRSFVLEEDNDSGHGPGKHNPVRDWKEKHGLRSFFNCPRSPDLSPIENAWKVPKQYIRQYPHWDTDTLKDLAEEGWKDLKQETINRWIESMPQRLADVIKSEGKMTGW